MQTDVNSGWKIAWTPERVARFWNWQSQQPRSQAIYFSRMVGDAILRTVEGVQPLQGVAVDFGAGPGYLTEKLMRRGMSVWATDVSEQSLADLSRKHQGNKRFLGTSPIRAGKTELGSGIADVIFLVETIEHLDDAALKDTFDEIRRLLKPDGVVVVTTPNSEDLTASQAYCPNCGCVFHTVQHIRSFDARSLPEVLKPFGIEAVRCESTLFDEGNPVLRLVKRAAHNYHYKKLPHLYLIGRKTSARQ